jgi:aminopeptidase N
MTKPEITFLLKEPSAQVLDMSKRALLLAIIVASALSHAVFGADDSSHTSPSVVADEAFWKSHLLKLQQAYQSLAENKMTAIQQRFDVTYYGIRLTIDPAGLHGGWLTGEVTIHGRPIDGALDTVQFDISQYLTVDSVKTGTSSLSFQCAADLISIPLPTGGDTSEFAVTIFYQGHPQGYGYGSFSFSSYNNKPTVASLSEPFFARTWWPCKDHPTDKADSVDTYVTIDDDLTVASNGSLVSIIDNGDGTKTTHWHESYPIATYLASLAIADYYVYSDTLVYQGYTMPIEFFHYGEPGDGIRTNNARVREMLATFSDIFGTYPFIREKYGQAQFDFGGGMEHQTCTSLGSFGESVMAHELAHQWWGDMVTCGSWHEIWLNEGFASYCEALWAEHKGGSAAYHNYMNSFEANWGAGDVLYVSDTTSIYKIFDVKEYRKGAWVLHMLRYTVGDSAFFRILRKYGSAPRQYGTALTADLQQIAEQQTGRNLSAFFHQWVYEGGRPDYEYAFLPEATDTGVVTYFFLNQVQQGYKPFQTDVDVRFFFPETTITVRLVDTLTAQNFVLRFADIPDSCVIDPDNWILNSAKRIEYGFRIVNNGLPDAFVSKPYSQQLLAAGGKAPYAWSAMDVSLPIGLSVSANGLLSGTPTDPGVYSVFLRVSDSDQPTHDLSVFSPLSVRLIHGDIDGQPQITLGDLLYLLRYLYKNGAAPVDLLQADLNCDGDVNLVDVVVLLDYLYQQGAAPCITTD